MFGTIRKHQTWLWVVIIIVIVISFVLYFSPYSKLNDAPRGRVNLGSINGQRISEEQYVHARNEVFLRHFFMTGNWPDNEALQTGGQVDRETYQWLLLIQKQEQMAIHVSPTAAAQAARAMVGNFARSGINSPEAFIRQVMNPRGLGVDDLERFVRHYLGVQELIATVGLTGELIPPREIQALYKRENEEVATEAVFFSGSNYLASVTVLPDAVTQFYTNRLASYRVPERLQVSYVKFDLTNYLAEAQKVLGSMTNMDLQIEEAYRQGSTNFLREVGASSLAEAKQKVREARLKQEQFKLATQDAKNFADPLFDMDPVRADNMAKLAKEKGLAVSITPPFDRDTPPLDLAFATDFARKIFSRTPDDPFAGPIAGTNALYVMALEKKIPSEIPPLDKIRTQVVNDYRQSQALTLARQAGIDFYQTLTNGLAQGKTFAAICAAAKLQPLTLPPFAISTRQLPEVEDRLSLNQLKQLAFTTPLGKPSNFQMTPEGGVILLVKSKLPLDEAKMNASLAGFTRAVRQNRQSEAFNEWFRREAEKGLRDTPLARQQQPPNMGPTPAPKKS